MVQNYNHNNKNQSTNQMPSFQSKQGVGQGSNISQNQESIMSNLEPGYTLARGRYIFKHKLGEGGFGVAFLADDIKNNRLVVIKTLNEKMRGDKDSTYFIDKFNNEAVKLAQCDHPHIVKLMDEIIYDESKYPYLVMEYIPGENLLIHTTKRSLLAQNEALTYIQQIADALKVVHSKNLFHLDVNPRNIMIRKIENNHEAVLIDFGTSRRADANLQSAINQFLSHSFAPIERYDQRQQGAYTDVYGLSATLYFMLTGKDPEDADRRANFLQNRQKDALTSPDVHERSINKNVNDVILWGMALEFKNRPQSIQEWLDKLLLDTNPSEVKNDYNDYTAPKTKPKAKIWLNSAMTGLIYGLITSPVQSIIAKADTTLIFSCWLLPLIGLTFIQYRSSFNLLNHKLTTFIFIIAATLATIIFLNQASNYKLPITMLIIASSIFWSLLCTAILTCLFPKQTYIKQ